MAHQGPDLSLNEMSWWDLKNLTELNVVKKSGPKSSTVITDSPTTITNILFADISVSAFIRADKLKIKKVRNM